MALNFCPISSEMLAQCQGRSCLQFYTAKDDYVYIYIVFLFCEQQNGKIATARPERPKSSN